MQVYMLHRPRRAASPKRHPYGSMDLTLCLALNNSFVTAGSVPRKRRRLYSTSFSPNGPKMGRRRAHVPTTEIGTSVVSPKAALDADTLCSVLLADSTAFVLATGRSDDGSGDTIISPMMAEQVVIAGIGKISNIPTVNL